MYKNNCLLLLRQEDKILKVTLGGEIDHHNAVSVRSEDIILPSREGSARSVGNRFYG